jgi:ElaB/YqjD/DUF883 family membrane-anchored ribosome-binding protein
VDSNEQHDERELEMIREEMERKRASLADKLGALESQVLGTVQSATDAVGDAKEVVTSIKDTVTESAEAVKETVSETVQSVAETFNVSRLVQNHPWAAMGCAVATGFAGGLLLGGRSREEEEEVRAAAAAGDFSALRSTGAPPVAAAPPPAPAAAPAAEEEGIGSQLMDSLGEAWERLSGGVQALAVGSLLGLVRQMATTSLPPAMGSEVGRFLDDVRDRLGGKTTELSRSLVGYVSEALSPKENGPDPDGRSQEPRAEQPAPRPQQRNGPRHRAAR